MDQLFRRYPSAVARSVEIADECAFDLRKATPRLPKHGIPEGETAASRLRQLTGGFRGAVRQPTRDRRGSPRTRGARA